jgi:hypothetical protein
MEKLICPQCGSNELAPFGAAFKCESCGTILKEDSSTNTEKKPVEPPGPKTHYAAPATDFRYDDENDGYEPLSTHTDGSDIDNTDTSATKLIFWIIVILCTISLCVYLLVG